MTSLLFSFRVLLPSLIILFAITAQAQSGRRQSKPGPAVPVPTPTPEPTAQPKETPKSDLGFIVGMDSHGTFDFYAPSYYTAVLDGCSDRLRKASSAKTVTTSREMNRGDAIKKAKAEKTTYVVLLRLVSFRMSGQARDQDLEIEYTVFAPVTAKIATSGKSYQNANRSGPVIVQPPGGGTSSILYRERLLKRAAEDAADRILSALHMRGPDRLVVPTAFQPPRKDAR